MTSRTYASPQAFKRALEDRLHAAAAKRSVPLERQRELLIFHRFLARIGVKLGSAATLKGGLVLELRIAQARATKDIDLRVQGDPGNLLLRLQEAAAVELNDFLSFEVRSHAEHPKLLNEGMQYEGLRFRAECRLAQKIYGRPFDVDVAFGEPMLGEPDEVMAPDVLGFAGIAPPRLRLYPVETHVAEKLHAYTLPRLRPNSRVKDLPDLALLASTRTLDATRLRRALEQTFTFRDTHALPSELPAPATSWEAPYAEIARDNRLAWPTLKQVTQAAKDFLDPVLEKAPVATWTPETWRWHP
ncbi:nucleotidyl transferase AbiEii/AbiGii toxin family protein [Corallococcus sp. BB11-1]|uniref:nucleotidyl transferase AbiEii/AbiGii toxin family protein n=1 Tax=Corallococcus sp. BB11-1 TaxID=2996783 RepID=UPI00226D75E0|nr:nucleotidyl transferase AbiEii/AbiGii toxin family protein [Corallococcus sp. BB11-1]MCY1032816.1 nucleotidyl transferase AbiEii/AbiGii toxin family protein [Corallococcus sp. BB11-1]